MLALTVALVGKLKCYALNLRFSSFSSKYLSLCKLRTSLKTKLGKPFSKCFLSFMYFSKSTDQPW